MRVLKKELEIQRGRVGKCERLLEIERGKGKSVRWEVAPRTLFAQEASRGGTV